MSNTRTWRRAHLAAAGLVVGLAFALPGTASAAECTPPAPPGAPSSGADRSANPAGQTAVQTCSPFEFRDIGRRH